MSMATEEALLDISDPLRFVLFGLECALNTEFNPAEVERLFAEGEGDTPSDAKRYTFREAPDLSITGCVDEHEGGTVWLRVESRRPFEPSLSAIVERAQYQVFRIKRHQDSVAIPDIT